MLGMHAISFQLVSFLESISYFHTVVDIPPSQWGRDSSIAVLLVDFKGLATELYTRHAILY